MIKKIVLLTALSTILNSNAQTVSDFESFSLTPNSAYSSTTSAPFQTNTIVFPYKWSTAFSFWEGGFSYTNKYDSVTAGFTNLYGVRPLKGFNNSATYVVAQDRGIIHLAASQTTVNGFYITNTTYDYKSMAKGDAFARKFGDTTGTGSGTTIPQGSYPDFFKVIVKGYKNGALKNDSVTVFLANFTFTNNAQDFILDTWQYVNTSILGAVDSIQFFMRSSDVGAFGINTPLFFGMDNFMTTSPISVGIAANSMNSDFQIYPNPFSSALKIKSSSTFAVQKSIHVFDEQGKVVYSQQVNENESEHDLSALPSGVYFLEILSSSSSAFKKIIKN